MAGDGARPVRSGLCGGASARQGPSLGGSCGSAGGARRSRARVGALAAALLSAYVAASLSLRRPPQEGSGLQQETARWEAITPAALLGRFEANAAYMRGAGWRPGESGGYLPEQQREVRLSLDPGLAHVVSWQAQSASGCGPSLTRAVLHMEAVIEGVDPVFAQEVLISPHYGLDWNPGIKDVVLRKFRRGGLNQDIPGSFYPSAGDGPVGAEQGARDADEFSLLGQVTEIPLPRPVEAAVGRRFTADWLAHRFECAAKRGYTIGTSANVSQLGMEAGVEIAQDLCHSAVLVAPWTADRQNGTVVHMVSHVDPHLFGALRSITLAATASTLTRMLQGVGRKAWEVQQTGRHPEIVC